MYVRIKDICDHISKFNFEAKPGLFIRRSLVKIFINYELSTGSLQSSTGY